jgi:hypothetical protein
MERLLTRRGCVAPLAGPLDAVSDDELDAWTRCFHGGRVEAAGLNE